MPFDYSVLTYINDEYRKIMEIYKDFIRNLLMKYLPYFNKNINLEDVSHLINDLDLESTLYFIMKDIKDKNILKNDKIFMNLIKRYPDAIITYCMLVLNKKRWPEAEPYIMEDPSSIVNYAIYIIKGEWPEAEPYLFQDPYSSYTYAVEVLKTRFKEAENIIGKNICWFKLYYDRFSHMFKGERWPEAEEMLLQKLKNAIKNGENIENVDEDGCSYDYKDILEFYEQNSLNGHWPEYRNILSDYYN